MFIAKLFGNSAYGNKDSFEEINTTKKTVFVRKPDGNFITRDDIEGSLRFLTRFIRFHRIVN